ncbi:hypothetical protein [Paracoccus sp. (in: a-proteobacteria)]|uniref:hypothetical protein n=1 Tax=Paracoccus sp. TaxID=267 RepID=UPI00321FDAF3
MGRSGRLRKECRDEAQFRKNVGRAGHGPAGGTAAGADPGRGHGKGHGKGNGAQARHQGERGQGSGYRADCPTGLAKKSPPCVPPGQARKAEARHGRHVGEILRLGDYVILRDPWRHDLATRPDWRYYRDGDRVYRVDRDTRRILAVLNLIDAFSD